ncbi:hypothetical protein J6590_014582 [Homalodisca vitripennis]|nr:hypothetical protein J6590_014582 [Homalodisca vitripennis]
MKREKWVTFNGDIFSRPLPPRPSPVYIAPLPFTAGKIKNGYDYYLRTALRSFARFTAGAAPPPRRPAVVQRCSLPTSLKTVHLTDCVRSPPRSTRAQSHVKRDGDRVLPPMSDYHGAACKARDYCTTVEPEEVFCEICTVPFFALRLPSSVRRATRLRVMPPPARGRPAPYSCRRSTLRVTLSPSRYPVTGTPCHLSSRLGAS